MGGAPPVASVSPDDNISSSESLLSCDVLSSLGLPSNIVYGFVQPWDPIVRLFSEIDPLYPLLDDIGADGNSLWASGPSRTLRPVIRSIVEEWEQWPTLRERFRETA